ncbi:hypothetical protein [Pedobacter frigidisoli]|uniref:hypothetical protein n=1 Tax=Pedobacter frigidisoli TaxID=2530455 RepID=UPI00292FDB83|nr:hypothetical protein [Pedobacter frigidisoli]
MPLVSSKPRYILDMVHNNPGEKPFQTKYNSPEYLKSQGFNGMVAHWPVNCAIVYQEADGHLSSDSNEQLWIQNKAKEIDAKLSECVLNGIEVYPFTDFLVFPESIWRRYGNEMVSETELLAKRQGLKNRKPDMQRKRTQKLLRAQISGIFNRFPLLGGLTLRFGETYLHDTPYHSGAGPIRDGQLGIADHITMLNILREEVCVKRNKKLFYRTWDFGFNFHTNPEYYLAVTNKIEPHPNLFFVIKYQQDDFHRMTPFNPTIGIGRHQQLIESQSRMEAYGKGAHPYYVGKGVIDGWPETKFVIDRTKHSFTGGFTNQGSPRGLKDILSKGLFAGVITWSNGGGWDGPYIKSELWNDLNTYVVAKWAMQPQKKEEEIFDEYTSKIGLKGYQADLFRELCLLSIEGVRKGQLNSYVSNAVWWSRDEYFSASDNEGVLAEALQLGKVDRILSEKAESTAIWLRIEAISKQICLNRKEDQEALEVSCHYGRIKYSLIEQMWILMFQKASGGYKKESGKKIVAQSIREYDRLWTEWHALKGSSEYCATLYTDLAFRKKRKGSIGEFVDLMRKY